MLVHGARTAFGLLTALVVAAISLFTALWLTLPGRWDHPVLYTISSLLVAYLVAVWITPWMAMGRMQRPLHIGPQPSLRVAAVTTFAPGAEPIEMLEQTVAAMVAMDYPHDTWVLDEGDDPDVKALCARYDARHFTRSTRPEYCTRSGPFAARSKYGNYNAWLTEHSDAYDILAAFDPDHVPEPSYLMRTLGYFCDPDVSYVQAPQLYYNQYASFIARGAAEESYTYYSSVQMASYAMGEPTVTGSHTVHRLDALCAVGGFPPHDAEDLYLTLVYRRAGWRGVYVPELLALGTTPVDWHGYLRQQMRWARALLDLKFRVLPKLVGGMSAVERVLGLLHGAYFLRPLILGAMYPMLVYMVVTNTSPSFIQGRAILLLAGLSVVFFLADRFRQRYYLSPRRERGVHWRAALLQYAKWPYFAVALWDAARGWHGDYEITEKSGQARRGSAARPHLALAAVLCVAIIVGIVWHGSLALPLAAVSLLAVALSVGIALSDARRFPPPFERERYRRNRADVVQIT